MLGLLGLMGALLAGVVADSMISGMSKNPDAGADDDALPGDTATEGAWTTDSEGQGDLLHWPETGDAPVHPDDPDYVSQSTDLELPPHPDQTLHGDVGDDILSGAGGDDVVSGGDGDDQLTGRSGDDLLQGGAGEDVLHGEIGRDTLQGGDGTDLLAGGADDDLLFGGNGADQLLGQDGADRLYGGAGNDTTLGGDANDTAFGGDGDDGLGGGEGDDSLFGDAGHDTLDGGNGNDHLSGDEGDGAFPETDFLNGGAGNDRLALGAGDIGSGGDGEDWFALNDWNMGDPPAQIMDYDADQDSIVVMFDPAVHADPQISLQPSDDPADVIVLLDGVALAVVFGGAGMTMQDVHLTPAQAA